jgi:hypothetical protein
MKNQRKKTIFQESKILAKSHEKKGHFEPFFKNIKK